MTAATQLARIAPDRRVVINLAQSQFDELEAAYPTMRLGERIRFSVAYTLQRKPAARLPVVIEARPGHQP